MERKGLLPGLLILWAIFFLPPHASADIYAYRDSYGVIHFTNVPPDSRYKLFLKSYTPRGDAGSGDIEDIIKEASRAHGLPINLLRAVIRAESNFDPKAVSPKGAMGLMQLMPGTARDLYVRDPFSPKENIMAGAKYLRTLLERFNWDLRLALAAYNAGPERVETSKGIPNIPETVEFVQRVLKFYMADR